MDFNTVNVAGYEANFHELLFLAAWLSIKDLHSRNDHITRPEVYKSLARTRVSRTTSALTLFRPGGGRKVLALTLNVYNFFKIQPNAAKLYEFF